MTAALVAYLVHSLFDTPETWIMALAALILGVVVAQLRPEPATHRYLTWVPIMWPVGWVVLLATGMIGYQVSQQYFLATTAADEGNWEQALTHLDVAQSLLPYDDSSILAMSSLLRGGLAATDSDLLDEAVAEFETLVALEPGWGAHRANLASLKWQQGQANEAIALLAEVVAQTPDVGLYQLNLLRWQAAVGVDDPAGWRRLMGLKQSWEGAPLWGEVSGAGESGPAEEEPATDIERAEALLLQGHLDAAAERFETLIVQEPYDARAHLGLAVVHLQRGDEVAAADSLRRAGAIFRLTRITGSDGVQVQMWQALLPGASAGRLEQFRLQMSEQSPYGPGIGGQGSYTLTVFLRLSPPADLLPQLDCFSVAEQRARPLQFVDSWYEREGIDERAWLDQILYGDGDGTVSCWNNSVASD